MLSSGESLYKCETVRLLPAFLFSHQNRLRGADFGDSFPPGEAKGAAAPV